jgi:hypothetical protein
LTRVTAQSGRMPRMTVLGWRSSRRAMVQPGAGSRPPVRRRSPQPVFGGGPVWSGFAKGSVLALRPRFTLSSFCWFSATRRLSPAVAGDNPLGSHRYREQTASLGVRMWRRNNSWFSELHFLSALRRFLSNLLPSCLSFRPPSASRRQLQSQAMLQTALLEGERKSGSIRYKIFWQSPKHCSAAREIIEASLHPSSWTKTWEVASFSPLASCTTRS